MGNGLRPFQPSDLERVQELIHGTIDSCYSGVYPPRAVAFFKQYHSLEEILRRADEGCVVVVEEGGCIVATGALLNGEICGVFVAPAHQGRGLGGLVMDGLEAAALASGCSSTRLSVSLTSHDFHERRGYVLTERLSHHVGEGQYLDYWEGEKTLPCPHRGLPE
jgi:GNAT superfamily N-acetyltransferase